MNFRQGNGNLCSCLHWNMKKVYISQSVQPLNHFKYKIKSVNRCIFISSSILGTHIINADKAGSVYGHTPISE